jgi:uncharacterized protein (DUF924 family)
MSAAADIVAFGREAGAEEVVGGGAEFDRACNEGFRDAHFAAAARKFDDWMARADGEIAQLGCDRS